MKQSSLIDDRIHVQVVPQVLKLILRADGLAYFLPFWSRAPELGHVRYSVYRRYVNPVLRLLSIEKTQTEHVNLRRHLK